MANKYNIILYIKMSMNRQVGRKKQGFLKDYINPNLIQPAYAPPRPLSVKELKAVPPPHYKQHDEDQINQLRRIQSANIKIKSHARRESSIMKHNKAYGDADILEQAVTEAVDKNARFIPQYPGNFSSQQPIDRSRFTTQYPAPNGLYTTNSGTFQQVPVRLSNQIRDETNREREETKRQREHNSMEREDRYSKQYNDDKDDELLNEDENNHLMGFEDERRFAGNEQERIEHLKKTAISLLKRRGIKHPTEEQTYGLMGRLYDLNEIKTFVNPLPSIFPDARYEEDENQKFIKQILDEAEIQNNLTELSQYEDTEKLVQDIMNMTEDYEKIPKKRTFKDALHKYLRYKSLKKLRTPTEKQQTPQDIIRSFLRSKSPEKQQKQHTPTEKSEDIQKSVEVVKEFLQNKTPTKGRTNTSPQKDFSPKEKSTFVEQIQEIRQQEEQTKRYTLNKIYSMTEKERERYFNSLDKYYVKKRRQQYKEFVDDFGGKKKG